ncbi:DUF2182 domain-containing protein [Pseudanabaenaceae cyanobacterium LEGE 13415]|nr:DUF2182 domain-containing protein [Pseudanabaenaceae cyanobacterium LEGE 13415]
MESQQLSSSWLRQWFIDQFGWAWAGVAIAWWFLIFIGQDHASMAHRHSVSIPHLLYALGAWETMLVAMMLPSVIPVAQLFRRVSQNQPDQTLVQVAFIAGYLIVWTGFAILSVSCDPVLQLFSHSLHHWISSSFLPVVADQVVFGVISIGVGLFQFTPLKQNCLQGCRSTATFIAQHYDRGWQSGMNLGVQHGLYCLGCCIALMIEMMVIGIHNLQWMLIFTAIMTLERLWKFGQLFAAWVGVSFIAIGLLSIFGMINFSVG